MLRRLRSASWNRVHLIFFISFVTTVFLNVTVLVLVAKSDAETSQLITSVFFGVIALFPVICIAWTLTLIRHIYLTLRRGVRNGMMAQLLALNLLALFWFLIVTGFMFEWPDGPVGLGIFLIFFPPIIFLINIVWSAICLYFFRANIRNWIKAIFEVLSYLFSKIKGGK